MNSAALLSKEDIYEKFPQIKLRYQIMGDKAIGEASGFGAVWCATDTWVDSLVALKISDGDLLAEVKLCRDIDGETVRVFDFYKSKDNWHAFAMEHLGGSWVTLSAYISKHRYKNNDIQHYFDSFEIIRSVLHGLSSLHGKPYQRLNSVIHADIKPANLFVLINPKKRPHTVFRMPSYMDMIKIIDLGVGVGRGKELRGYTPAYRPEGMTQAAHGYDLYAVAVSFVELLTGRRPTHQQMGDKRRLRKALAKNSSGSEYIDDLAIDFVTTCKNAASQKATTAKKLIKVLDEKLFDKESLSLMSLRGLVKGRSDEGTKADIVKILYPIVANYWGWMRRTEKRCEVVKDFVDDLLADRIIFKGSNSKRYRVARVII
ncbi:hypothetical protein PsyrCH409_10690 [Pseudomonas viridiflava]|uniref:protein kinase domain-containing protein n=1 Tax=Pseudomonas viridiflava TaxID=33069 RepID=UPI000BBD743C|nr:hypothetical protein [Pseudomonas viridiflava]PCK92032.1 hypothetical protein PsyrCH409_10690 [Pseudomonas viridiflava]